MKIEGMFGNPNLTVEAMRQKIETDFPTLGLSDEEMFAMSQVRLLRVVEYLLSQEVDLASRMLTDGMRVALDGAELDKNYLSALARIDRQAEHK